VLRAEEDELENINLLELEKAKEFQERKKKKPTYDVYGDLDSGKKSILAQYDEKPDRAVLHPSPFSSR
jgi:polynucleotide 5'-kinase involved in rRNA processing